MRFEYIELFRDAKLLENHPPIPVPEDIEELTEADRYASQSLCRFDWVGQVVGVDFKCAAQADCPPSGQPGAALMAEYPEHYEWALQQFLAAFFDQAGEKDYGQKMRMISECPPGSLGAALWRYYAENDIPKPSEKSLFPKRYISVHDAHHVLLGVPITQQGELLAIAFECGLMTGPAKTYIMPLLAQLAVFLAPYQLDLFAPEEMKRAWSIGAGATSSLLEDWDFWSECNDPLDEVRKRYNITPLSDLWG